VNLDDLMHSLKGDLLSMSHDEKLALVSSIRDDRRVSKHAITHKVRQKKDKTDKMVDQFEKLGEEERRAILSMLGGENGG